MNLATVALIYLLGWSINWFNSDIIQYRSATNKALIRYNLYNVIFKWLNIVLLIVTVGVILMSKTIPHQKAYLVFLSEYVIFSIIILPLTMLSLNYLTNKLFTIIHWTITIINLIFVAFYLLYPYLITSILDYNDHTKLLISQIVITVCLYLFVFLLIYAIFIWYEISTLSHKIMTSERYLRVKPKFKVDKKILQDSKTSWSLPIIFSPTKLKEVLGNQQLNDVVLTRMKALPELPKINSKKKA